MAHLRRRTTDYTAEEAKDTIYVDFESRENEEPVLMGVCATTNTIVAGCVVCMSASQALEG